MGKNEMEGRKESSGRRRGFVWAREISTGDQQGD